MSSNVGIWTDLNSGNKSLMDLILKNMGYNTEID